MANCKQHERAEAFEGYGLLEERLADAGYHTCLVCIHRRTETCRSCSKDSSRWERRCPAGRDPP